MDSRSGIPRMSKNERSRKFNYKNEKKTTIPLYPRNYVNEKGAIKIEKLVKSLS